MKGGRTGEIKKYKLKSKQRFSVFIVGTYPRCVQLITHCISMIYGVMK